MTNVALQKHGVGNTHLRFDEGGVAPAATPRRGNPLYNMVSMMVLFAAFAAECSFGAERPDVMAIYYPCWAPTPALESYFGKGWTEWDYLKSAPPRFPGHQQPIVPTCGYLKGDDPDDVAREIDLAADHGIDVFLFDYYYYAGLKLMHESLENGFLRAKNRSRIKFAIMWCCHEIDNEFRPDPKKSRERMFTLAKTEHGFAMLIDECMAYFREPNYYRHNGKLYFSIYSPQVMMDKVGVAGMRRALDAARAKIRAAGLGEVEFNAQGGVRNSREILDAGFDSLTDYVFHPYNDMAGQRAENGGSWLFDYGRIGERMKAHWVRQADGPLPYNPIVPTGWDPTPRARVDVKFPLPKGENRYPYGEIYTNATPRIFGKYLEMAKDFVNKHPRRSIVQVYAWNEYTEGGWLMPDNFNGDARLKEIKRVMGLKSVRPCSVSWGSRPSRHVLDDVKASSFGWNPTNATKCLQSALDSGARKVIVDRQAGDWLVDMVHVRSNTEVVFEDGVRVVALPGGIAHIVDNLIRVRDSTNVVLRGESRGENRAILQMRRDDYLDPAKYIFSGHRHAIGLFDVENVTLRDLKVLDSGGDGVYFLGVRKGTVENCVFSGHARQGASIIDVSGVAIRNCVFENTGGALPECGMDIEPGHAGFNIENLLVENCVFRSNNCSGVSVNVSSLKSDNRNIAIVYRDCDMYDNVQRGVWCVLGYSGHKPVKGRILFDGCRMWNNTRGPLQVNNLGSDGPHLTFRKCVFDCCGSEGSIGAPIQLVNGEIKDDLNNVYFDRCRLVNAPDGVSPVSFGAMTGGGVVKGGARGVLDVAYKSGRKDSFDFGTLEKLYVPRPELRMFETGVVDFKKLVPACPDARVVAKQRPGGYRSDFTFIQHIRSPGEYTIHFSSMKVGRRQFIEVPVTVFDVNGTPHDMFVVKDSEFSYRLKAQSRNSIYRFVVKPNGCRVKVWSVTPGNGIVATDFVHWLTGIDQSIYFLAKKGRDVKIEMKMEPSEYASAELLDADGNIVDKCVKTGTGVILHGARAKDAPDEIWSMHISKFWDDLHLRLGDGTGGVYSYDPDLVLIEKRP